MGFDGFIRQIAAQEHVPVLDPATLEANRLEAFAQNQAAAFFPVDNTHSSAAGATLIAGEVAAAIRNAHLQLAGYLES